MDDISIDTTTTAVGRQYFRFLCKKYDEKLPPLQERQLVKALISSFNSLSLLNIALVVDREEINRIVDDYNAKIERLSVLPPLSVE